jgi:prephenate dehydrogenase
MDLPSVTILGLGLMGGSLALALRGRCAALSGYDHDLEVVDQALARGIVTRGSTDLGEALAGARLVVVATPVRAILALLPRVAEALPDPFHLLDLGSTKAEIVARMAELPQHVSPVGGHPLCGKETSGLAGAEATLFREKVFVLTPLARTRPETLALAHTLVDAIGARALVLDAARHDRLAARISHVPYLTAIALVAAAEAADDELAWTLAASGFRDSTRLAASGVTMMTDILTTNRTAALEGLADVQAALSELRALLADGDEAALRAYLEARRQARRGL